MYRLVIADDEADIRRGMSKFIDWKALGFEVVADFEDGKDLIEWLQDNETDVILTDIQMQEVSGLEVAKYVQENDLDIFVVVISRSQRFEYAKKALQYDVEDYLIKPIEMGEVQRVFQGIVDKIHQRERSKNYRKIGSVLPIDPDGFYSVINMSLPEEMPQEKDGALASGAVFIKNIFGDSDKFYSVVITLSSQDYKIVVFGKNSMAEDEFRSGLEKYLQDNIDSVRKLLGVDIQYELLDVNYTIIGFSLLMDLMDKDKILKFERCIDNFEPKQSDTARAAVLHAVEYMKLHYQEPLSLKMMAERYYLNPSYFSRIFKENTGDNFTDRLMAIRMEEAKELLKEGKLKVYEISEKVGYTSEKYFFRVFKQYTGISPSEYKRTLGLK